MIINGLPQKSGIELRQLWAGTLSATSTNITLSESITNFTMVLIVWYAAGLRQRDMFVIPQSGTFDVMDGVMVYYNGSSTYYASIEGQFTDSGTKFHLEQSRKNPSSWGSSNYVSAIYGVV